MKRKTVFGSIAAIAAAGVIAGISVVWPGLDAQDAPPAETAVWALQTGDGHRYARVNTAVGELDTVRRVTNPSSIAQASGSAFVFADGKVARIDEAMPANLDEEALAQAGMMPPGTQDAFTSGPWVAYRTDAVPFSFEDKDKKPTGYMVELCRSVIGVIERQIGNTHIHKLGLQPNLKVLPIPLLEADWYLPLSHRFTEQHPELAQRLWQALREQRQHQEAELSQRYLQAGDANRK